MDYKTIYNDLIKSRQVLNRVKVRNAGLENHHIHPLKLCRYSKRYGELSEYAFDIDGDSPDNVVVLTSKEHYIAHLLLARIYGGDMWYAANQMAGRCSREYSIARKYFAEMISERNRGHDYADGEATSKRFKELWATDEYRERMKSRKPRSFTDEQRKAHSDNWKAGKYAGVSEKMAERLRGVKKERIECPHCHLYSAPAFFHRWHGDNCKHKESPLSKKQFKLLDVHGNVVAKGVDPYVDAESVVENRESRRTMCNYMKRNVGEYTITQGNLEGYTVIIEEYNG